MSGQKLSRPVLGEDAVRAGDRARVARARETGQSTHLAWLLIGPGILAMLGENDGPSMISYAADGASYGLGFFLPFIVVLFAVAYVCQEMAMRVGAVTNRGFGELLLARYGRTWGWFGAADLLVTNLVTLVSEFVALRVGLAYFHLGAPVAVIGGLLLVVLTLTGGRYRRWERIVLGLAVFNGLFLVAAIMVRPDPATIGMAFLTWSPLPTGSTVTLLFLLTATIGATVTPWMVFFQQGASADKGMTSSDLKHGRIDTAIGGGLAAIFGCAALVVGATRFGHGGTGIQGMVGAGFPAVFGAHSGGIVGGIFAIGLIQAGAVAILTISASTAYAAGEAAGISHSFNATPRGALPFYAVNVLTALVAGSVILIPGIPLVSIALNANILATVLLPVTLIFLLMLANDRQLMGAWANKRSTNIASITVIVIISTCAAGYAVASLLQTLHLLPA